MSVFSLEAEPRTQAETRHFQDLTRLGDLIDIYSDAAAQAKLCTILNRRVIRGESQDDYQAVIRHYKAKKTWLEVLGPRRQWIIGLGGKKFHLASIWDL